jgi:hypothetical protein
MDLAPYLSWFLPGVGLAYVWLRQVSNDVSQRPMNNDPVAQNPAEVGCSLR